MARAGEDSNDPAPSSPYVEPYETRLDRDTEWALTEGSLFFEDRSLVNQTLHRVTRQLDRLGIPYAVAGGMALFSHGYRRFTENIDLLVTPDGLCAIHAHLPGAGYVRSFTGARSLRDSATGVKIGFLVAGEFPGDRTPKPVSFPSPETVHERLDGVAYVTLPVLIELKLASGLTNPGRLKDIADVLELIRMADVPAAVGAGLNPFVQEKYRELWALTQSAGSPEP
jgi:hypothetical protein